ncbi:hypothetical protein NLI96_g8916 [Meripilus lineatus]|uniref:F-box domain-containing protein n=1 Tax=Meripilus lineatus TaxID=2056292 RepID=A0AAD5V1P7_9APHY|nr:hypothetical protein NLI96_g8916 [Physisporinus lineatus]
MSYRLLSSFTDPILPLEVLEHVIGFVGFDVDGEEWGTHKKLETLQICALVCRSWVAKSRFLLYEVVNLNNKRKATNFINTIASSPRLGEYVQDLRMNLKGKHEDWIYSAHQVLPSLLPNLYRLEHHQLPSLHSVFFTLSPQFKIITSLRLSMFKSWTFREIARLLNGFPNLKKNVGGRL